MAEKKQFTPGKWEARYYPVYTQNYIISNKERFIAMNIPNAADAELIASAPDLLAENENLKAQIKQCQMVIDSHLADLVKLDNENTRLKVINQKLLEAGKLSANIIEKAVSGGYLLLNDDIVKVYRAIALAESEVK